MSSSNFFRGGVEADWLVGGVIHGEGNFFVAAVNGTGAGVNQMFRAEMSAALQHVEEADDVALDVCGAVVYRMAHARLSRQVHHVRGAVFSKQRVQKIFVGQVAAQKCPRARRVNEFEPILLQAHVVIVVHVVHADNFCAGRQEPPRQVAADETRRTRHQNFLQVDTSPKKKTPAVRGRSFF